MITCVLLILCTEFVGIESCGRSMRSFRFAKVDGGMKIIYEFEKDELVGFDLEVFREDQDLSEVSE